MTKSLFAALAGVGVWTFERIEFRAIITQQIQQWYRSKSTSRKIPNTIAPSKPYWSNACSWPKLQRKKAVCSALSLSLWSVQLARFAKSPTVFFDWCSCDRRFNSTWPSREKYLTNGQNIIIGSKGIMFSLAKTKFYACARMDKLFDSKTYKHETCLNRSQTYPLCIAARDRVRYRGERFHSLRRI